ncbi:MAG: CCA tRNA nucleotidyltransferase [Acidobacteria bacterium]|nr:CCA tRNA nucleotidyltransferase [Acidobacteriota bacterium]
MKAEEKLARQIVETLRSEGETAYFVGGCVRDRLLGRDVQDWDVATSAPAAKVRSLFEKSEEVGAAFGVVLVHADGATVEVATFRKDFDYQDGRRPERVTFTSSVEEDVHRRDFTINGLLYDPRQDRVLDLVVGQEDIANRLVRAIGNPLERFEEDHLRMLRAVRFAARLGFQIEVETRNAIQKSAPAIQRIAAERIRDELARILTEGGARRGLELLDETGLLTQVLPEVAALQGVEQSPEHHPEGDVWTHTLLLLENLPADAPVTLAMGALLHDIGKPATFERGPDRIRFYGHVEVGVEIGGGICRRLRFSNAETEQILALIANHMRFMHLQQMRPSKLKRFLRQADFGQHLELHRLDCTASHGKLDNYEFARQALEHFGEEGLRPTPLVTGKSLIEDGFQAGPSFSQIIEAAEEAQLEGAFDSKAGGMEWVRRRWSPPAGHPTEGRTGEN